jgi:hypothetical protein
MNKQVQSTYWKLLKESTWNKYHLVPAPQGVDSILEPALVADPDFNDLDALPAQIERAALQFIQDAAGFLSTHET